ncbi:electron transfer flavoprotein subunit beta/FixA family protein [Homoserinimonas sp. OAct 916]|uniref:electron transfer flavoprotein subunit beta/FixA family protein n=1 Tax=Homoserinimonas sp. OAct 916 TaxID=2211450 RepID=UPI000DBE3C98|nr:electron transfer flavoprotein subunit beta/FixA family protein [Homoserinimonas sp. OAct 916]
MKLIVLVKEVPDTYGDRKLNLETGLADRGASEAVLDEISERALEAALTYADANPGTEVVALAAAPAGSVSTVRKALGMGADRAIHVADEALAGADIVLTAQVLAAAIKRDGFDLVISGNVSTDGSGGMVPAAIAEYLEVPQLTGLSEIEITDSKVSGTRPIDGGAQRVSAQLPAVVSITEAFPDPRFPSFKGIMAAKKKPFETVSLADLGVRADDPEVARSIMLSIAEKPPREAGIKIVDDGEAGKDLADFLLKNRLA